MKFVLLYLIRFYWFIIPESKRRKCIFNKSCSKHVYDSLVNNGLKKGIHELIFRIKNCQPEFDIFIDHETGRKKMLLKSGVIVDEEEIAQRLKIP